MNIDKVFKIVITVLADTTNIFTCRAGALSGPLDKWADVCDLPADVFRELADIEELNGVWFERPFLSRIQSGYRLSDPDNWDFQTSIPQR